MSAILLLMFIGDLFILFSTNKQYHAIHIFLLRRNAVLHHNLVVPLGDFILVKHDVIMSIHIVIRA